MKKCIWFCGCMLLLNIGFAQKNQLIKGKVKDEQNNPVAMATVQLLQNIDSTVIKLEITNEQGEFEILTQYGGNALIKVSNVGFDIQYTSAFNLSNDSAISLQPIQLVRSKTTLDVLTINAKKPMFEVQADKTVFNVEQSINATGSDAFELLRKSPGIQVDNNDNLSMKGKTGVKIYIDGKITPFDSKDLAAYLKGINSSDIEAIEMISNPSAKYDASGNAGIINIKLKKNKKFGTNGNLSLGYIQGIHARENIGLSLNYRNKKINVFGNLGLNNEEMQNTMDLYRVQNDSIYDLVSRTINKNKNINAKAGVDFFINKQHTIGFLTKLNQTNRNENGYGNTPISLQQNQQFIKTLVANSKGKENNTNVNFNLNYRFTDTSGTEVNVDADHGVFTSSGNRYQPNEYVDVNNVLLFKIVNRNNRPVRIDISAIKLDAECKKWNGKLGFGVKSAYVKTANTFEFFEDDASGNPFKILSNSNAFQYIENVNAVYANFNKSIKTKWTYQLGLRMEQTNSEGTLTRADGIVQTDNNVKKSYIDWFPSGALTYNINTKHALNLTYSRRIDRPTYQDLNPFENKLDELTYQKGNAFLRPQYTNVVELSHIFMGFLTTTLGYNHVKDYATEVTDTIRNATYVQQQNLATQQLYTFNISSPTPIKKWWNGFVNIWYNYQVFKGAIGKNQLRAEIPNYGVYLQQSFTLGKAYSAEVSGWYSGPSVWGATWKTKPQGSLDLGLQKQLLHNTATLKLAITDLLFTSPWRAVTNFGGTYISGGGNWESRTCRLTFSWRFGSNQISAARDRKSALDAESKRIKGGGN